jgi:hypothetical protein
MPETLSDVIVNIDVANPASVVGFGLLLILAPVVAEGTPTYKEYANLTALTADYAEGTDVHGKARDFFAQANAGTPVAVQTYTAGSVSDALDNCFAKDWHFAVVAGGVAADILAAAQYIEAKSYKFLFLQVADASGITPYGPISDTFVGYKRTAVYVHAVAGENLDAAVIGNAGSLTVGSITWKFRGNLSGITPDDLTPAQVQAIHTAGGNAYVLKAGIPQTTEGKTAGGEYIDALHGDDWVKANIETSVQDLLQTSGKLPYTAAGIALIASRVEGVLNTAYTNGIVDTDPTTNLPAFSVNTVPITSIDRATIDSWTYSGTSFSYTRQSAIHQTTIHGEIAA